MLIFDSCRGLVSASLRDVIDKANATKDYLSRLDKIQRACFANIDCNGMYNALDKIGLSYGPEFQGMLEMSVGDGFAVGILQVTDTRSTMPQQFETARYVHPTTFDSFLRASIASLCGGNLSNIKNPGVPTFIHEVFVSGAISAQPDDIFQLAADSKLCGFREVYSNIMVLERESLEPVVRISGLKCLAIPDTANSQSGDEDSKILKHTFKVVWEPDIDLISKESLSIIFQETEPLTLMAVGSISQDDHTTALKKSLGYARIAKYISILSHKDPDLNYLEIGAGTGGLTSTVFKALGGSDKHRYPRLRSYTYTDASPDFVLKAAQDFGKWAGFMNFEGLDIERDPHAQGFGDQSFDVVLVANILHETTHDISKRSAHIRKLLKPGGKLVFLEVANSILSHSSSPHNEPPSNQPPWRAVLQNQGFTDLDGGIPDFAYPTEAEIRVIIATAVQRYPQNDLNQHAVSHQIVIIRPDYLTNYSEQLLNELTATLKRASASIDVCLFSELETEDFTRTVYISLVELENPMLANISSSSFLLLQRLIQQCARIMWITRGGMRGSRPELSLVHGLARSIRTEYESLPFVTIDLDSEQILAPHKTAKCKCTYP